MDGSLLSIWKQIFILWHCHVFPDYCCHGNNYLFSDVSSMFLDSSRENNYFFSEVIGTVSDSSCNGNKYEFPGVDQCLSWKQLFHFWGYQHGFRLLFSWKQLFHFWGYQHDFRLLLSWKQLFLGGGFTDTVSYSCDRGNK